MINLLLCNQTYFNRNIYVTQRFEHNSKIRVQDRDVFEKSFQPSFSGKWIKNPKKITIEIVKSVIENSNNIIGIGSEGVVYRIPESDFCVKVPHFSDKTVMGFNYNVCDIKKINHVVAEGINEINIMKYIPGENLIKLQNPSEIVDLPISSYTSLLKQVSEANENGLKFDHAASNVIYNKNNKSLTAIDFYEPSADNEIYFHPVTEVYTCLKSSLHEPNGSKNHIRIINRLLNSVFEEIKEKNPKFIIEENDFDRLFTKIRDDIPQNLPPQFLYLKKAFGKLFDLKDFESKGQNIQKQFNGLIKYAKCLTNQIFEI